MNVMVILKQVPDLVEELELNESNTGLDQSGLRYIISEYDDHALEQSLLLKEQYGGSVQVICLDRGDVTETLFTAAAKGADKLLKITADLPESIDNHTAAFLFKHFLDRNSFDLILTGVQAIDDSDGSIGPILAGYLDLPYIGVVRGVTLSGDKKCINAGKEYPGGLISEINVKLPAVLGIQAAMKPPRYVPIAKIRQAQKTTNIEEVTLADVDVINLQKNNSSSGIKISKISKPESSNKAEIFNGNIEEVTSQIASLLAEKGILR